jgi:hypothetical protein
MAGYHSFLGSTSVVGALFHQKAGCWAAIFLSKRQALFASVCTAFPPLWKTLWYGQTEGCKVSKLKCNHPLSQLVNLHVDLQYSNQLMGDQFGIWYGYALHTN